MKKAWKALKRLHGDEGGAVAIEKLLIVVVIVIPLLVFLIWFKDDLIEWVTGEYEKLK